MYLAARYSRREELLGYARELEHLGHVVTSRWIRGEHEALDAQLVHQPEIAVRFAREDLDDLRDAEVVIAFTEPPGPQQGRGRGGRHVEAGWVIGWNDAHLHTQHNYKRLIIVGPPENVFYALPDVWRFDTWPECVDALDELSKGLPL